MIDDTYVLTPSDCFGNDFTLNVIFPLPTRLIIRLSVTQIITHFFLFDLTTLFLADLLHFMTLNFTPFQESILLYL